jgi:hypothetical protein
MGANTYLGRTTVTAGSRLAVGAGGGGTAGLFAPTEAGADFAEGPRGPGDGYTAAALNADIGPMAARAQAALKEAKMHASLTAAREKFTRAYLLNIPGGGNAEVAAEALEGIERIGRMLTNGWKRGLPALDKPLDLVIRDKSVAEALDAAAAAAGLKITLVPGSAEDAAAMLGRQDVRITFLDLRNATVAQAMDWILVPARMTWWVEKGEVVAATARRAPGESAWVYDVSLAAVPAADEFGKDRDYQKCVGVAKKAADAFLAGVRKGIGAKDEDVLWYAPGQLLVIGNADTHAAATKLLAALADPKAKLEGDLAELQKVTATRAEARREAVAKRFAVAEKVRTARALVGHSWDLLAASLSGRLDLEALTEVEVAWRHPATAEFLKGPQAVVVARSAWAVAEAARGLPKEDELAVAAKSARERLKPAADAALAALEKSPNDAKAYFQVLYAAMAMRDDEAFVARARAAFEKADASKLGRWSAVAAAILGPADKADAKALRELVAELAGTSDKPGAGTTAEAAAAGGLGDGDIIALVAVACRRAGGGAWENFRAESKNLLGSRPLDGGVVVFVNSLAGSKATLASARR